VRVLATSRIPLGVHGEIDYSVDPLAISPEGATSAELERSPAVQLFLDRALAVRRDLATAPGALATVGRICRDVDGLPLSIELAAARAKGLGLDEIAARLGDRFRFLRAWRRVADPRHQSLHATMDWSYELLRPAQQRAFARLSVFAGGFTTEAAEAVCGVGIDALIELVEHSLLRSLPAGRYAMLGTVHEYARERLDATGEADELDRRLLTYLLRLTDRPHLEGFPGEEEWLRRVEAERANIRRSLYWALMADPVQALRLATELERFWVIHDHVEGFHWVSEALSRATTAPPALRAAALRCLGDTLFWTRDKERSAKAWEESLALFRQLADVPNVAAVLDRLAGAQLRLGRLEDARASAEESLARYEAIGDRRGALYTLGTLGRIEWRSGDPGRGAELIQESLARAREFGDAWWETYHLCTLAELSLERGDLDEADRLCRRSLEIALRIDNRWTVVSCIALLAASAHGAGDVERAGRLWGGLVALERAGDPPVDPALASRFQVGASPDAAVAAGRVMDAAEVIAFALGG
jgi:predicted ATPase